MLKGHDLRPAARLALKGLGKDYDKSEDDIKALQSVGQIIGEVLKQLDEERVSQLNVAGNGKRREREEELTRFCTIYQFIVKASSGPRYVVGIRSTVPKHKLKNGTRVSLDSASSLPQTTSPTN